MAIPQTTNGPLQGIRVLDFTQGSEQYCGKLFAQLGASVTLVEPLLGSAIRRDGPFVDHIPHKERSLSFAYFNQGKRGIALDLEHAQARDIVHSLVGQTDLLIESYKPGQMSAWGLGYEALRKIQPRMVMTSISAFGQTGPFAHYEANDLVSLAYGGLLSLGGYPDIAPIAPFGNQALVSAAQFSAVASMAALLQAEGSQAADAGQHVDVSVQESVAMALENAVQFVELEKTVRKRNGGEQRQAGTGVFPCKDGMVYLMAGGVASNKFWNTTTNWLVEVGAPQAEQLREARWLDNAFLQTPEAKQIFSDIFLPFASQHTKAELYAQGQQRRIPICPVSTTTDLLANRQLAYRQFFEQTTHPFTGATLTMPGAPYQLAASPWQLGRPAPRLGEHTCAILDALGYDRDTQSALLREGVIA